MTRRLVLLIVAAALLALTAQTALSAPAGPPTGLTGIARSAASELAWQPVSGATAYRVQRGTSLAAITQDVSPAGGVAATTLTDNGAANGTTYYYRVTALGGGAESGPSNVVSVTPRAATCASSSPVVAENCFPGSGAWRATDAGPVSAGGIEAFAGRSSINKGESVAIKVNSGVGSQYRIEVYRTGSYGGATSRLVSTIENLAGGAQPACLSQATTTGLLDCSGWSTSATLTTTASWPSGVYILKVIRANGSDDNVLLTVRDDQRAADVVFLVPDTSYQAYNNYGGKSLYDWNSFGSTTVAGTARAVKVSFDRPYEQVRSEQRDWYAHTDAVLVEWLEEQGYDVAYAAASDLERDPALASRYTSVVSGAHDEYYSNAMRGALESARGAGTSLFFSGANAVYWQIRFEASPASGDARRVEVGYKTIQSGATDPQGPTSTWRDPARANRPENALIGQMYIGDADFTYFPLRVSAAEGEDPVWRHTGLDQQAPGTFTNVGNTLVGWEWDARVANGAEPAGVATVASSPVNGNLLIGNGSGQQPGSATTHVTRYVAASGATVFATGTNHWYRGLGINAFGEGEPNLVIRQATTNVLADTGVLPATPSADIVFDGDGPPAVVRTTPANGATGVSVNVTPTATFSRAMNPATINGSSFTLRTQGGQAVAATVEYNTATRRATLTPSAPLAVGSYTAQITTAATATDGTPLTAPATWSFTTTTPVAPTVTSTNPANNATGVPPQSAVSATFSRDIDPQTLTAQSFRLTGPGGQAVAGTITYQAATRTATLTPQAALALSTAYTATLTTAIRASDGVPMASQVTFGFTTAATACPCQLFPNTATPAVTGASTQDGRPGPGPFSYELGVRVTADGPAQIRSLRFYKSPGETGTHIGRVWSSAGTQLAQVSFTGESASGWQTQLLATPLTLTAGQTYVISVNVNAFFSFTEQGLAQAITSGPIRTPVGQNGVYANSAGVFPASSYNNSNYFVDLVAVEVAPPPLGPAPTVTSTNPANNATGVPPQSAVSATFSRDIDPQTLTAQSFRLTGPGGQAVAGTITYQAATRTATLTPQAALALSTAYTATLTTAIRASDGVPMASQVTFGFTTAATACPCQLFPNTATPAVTGASTQDGRPGPGPFSYELGVRVTADGPAQIRSLRFYKSPGETGTHIGRVWSSAGTQLAQVSFTGESASGWQTQLLATPLTLTAGQTYVISVNVNAFFSFTEQGLAQAITSGPIRTPVGQNGVYANSAGVFPASSYNNSNYFVDLVAVEVAPPPLGPAPTVTSTNPANNATGVPPQSAVSATFSRDIDPQTLTAQSFRLTGPGGQAVAGTITYQAATRTATLTPQAALALSTAYTATLTTAIRASDGVPMASQVTFGFTTAATACPCQLFPNTATPAVTGASTQDGRPGPGPFSYELGVRVTADGPAQIRSLRFYKSPGETGTHIGRVWSSAGTQLAQVSFTGESASGWQTQLLATPLTLTAGQTYVISVNVNAFFSFTEQGLAQAITSGPIRTPVGQNGVYANSAGVFPASSYNNSNYFVDLVAVEVAPPPLGPAPTVTSTNPANNATGVPPQSAVSATFSRDIDPQTLTAQSFRLTGPGGQAVAGTITYQAATRTATLTPQAALALSTAYTATLTTAIRASDGVPMASQVTFGFTTAATACPCQLFPNTATPAVTGASTQDGRPGPGPFSYELGVRVTADGPAQIRSLRFYKSPGETGTHIGRVWSSAGTQLAQVSFTGESASGWQTQLLATPLTLTAGQTYVISVNVNAFFSFTEQGLAQAITSGPIRTPVGQNGVYANSAGVFPASSYNNSNYFADLVVQ